MMYDMPSGEEFEFRASMDACVEAYIDASAKLAERAMGFTTQEQKLDIHWFTQSIIFNAISILYIYILRVFQSKGHLDQTQWALLEIAQHAQDALSQATTKNPPCLRSSHVLTQLRAEVQQKLASIPFSEGNSTCNGGIQGSLNEPEYPGLDIHFGEGETPLSFWHWFDDLPNFGNG